MVTRWVTCCSTPLVGSVFMEHTSFNKKARCFHKSTTPNHSIQKLTSSGVVIGKRTQNKRRQSSFICEKVNDCWKPPVHHSLCTVPQYQVISKWDRSLRLRVGASNLAEENFTLSYHHLLTAYAAYYYVVVECLEESSVRGQLHSLPINTSQTFN